jgi:hypothetical protein
MPFRPIPFEGGMPRRNPKLPLPAAPISRRPMNNYALLSFLRRGRNPRGIREF